MNNQVIKSDFRLNEERQTYSVTIKDKNTGETIQQYDTKIALIFGVVEEDKEKNQQDNIMMIQLGDGFQISALLQLLNNKVNEYLGAIFSTDNKLKKGGKKVG